MYALYFLPQKPSYSGPFCTICGSPNKALVKPFLQFNFFSSLQSLTVASLIKTNFDTEIRRREYKSQMNQNVPNQIVAHVGKNLNIELTVSCVRLSRLKSTWVSNHSSPSSSSSAISFYAHRTLEFAHAWHWPYQRCLIQNGAVVSEVI